MAETIVDQLLVPTIQQDYKFNSFSWNNVGLRSVAEKLRLAAEDAKMQLCRNEKAHVTIEYLGKDEAGREMGLDHILAQSELKRATQAIFEQTVKLCRDLLRDSLVAASDVERIVVSGSATRLPFVIPLLSDPQTGLGVAVKANVDPLTSIVRGTAIAAWRARSAAISPAACSELYEPATEDIGGSTKPRRAGVNFHVFISYRRSTASAEARLIRAELALRHKRVFLDVDDLRAGYFDNALLERIEQTPVFIVILAPGALDRCNDPRDWLRQEIAHAVTTKRTIVPVRLSGFAYPSPEMLPEEIRSLPRWQSLLYHHEYFKEFIEKLSGYLDTILTEDSTGRTFSRD
jgi:Hsp70 protein/TIR domain